VIGRVIPGTRRLDLVVLSCALTLSALGVLFVASATTGTRYEGLASRQAIWLAVGIGAMIVAILFDYRMLLKFSFAIYCACLLPLTYLLFFGETIANVRSWIRVGQFQFQPAELSKIATALLVAYLFENEDDARLHASTLAKLSAIVGVPVGTVKSRLHRGRIALAKAMGITREAPRSGGSPDSGTTKSGERADAAGPSEGTISP